MLFRMQGFAFTGHLGLNTLQIFFQIRHIAQRPLELQYCFLAQILPNKTIQKLQVV